MAGVSLDAAALIGSSEDVTNGGATGLTSVVTPVSFSVVSDESNQLWLWSPQVLIGKTLVMLSNQTISAGSTYYCNVTKPGRVSISSSMTGDYSVPICFVDRDGTVKQFHTGTLSIEGEEEEEEGGGEEGGGEEEEEEEEGFKGIKFVGTNDSTNWKSSSEDPDATYTFKTNTNSNVVVDVTGTETNATITIGVYYK